MKFSFPSAPFRFATLTSTPHGGRKRNITTTTNNQRQSTKFISGLDPGSDSMRRNQARASWRALGGHAAAGALLDGIQ